MKVFKKLKCEYQYTGYPLAKNIERLTLKKVRNKCQLFFNKKCNSYVILPASLKIIPKVKTAYGKKIAQKYSEKCLRAWIVENKTELNKCCKQLTYETNQLALTVPIEIYNEVVEAITLLEKREYDTLENKRKNKFDKLFSSKPTQFRTKQIRDSSYSSLNNNFQIESKEIHTDACDSEISKIEIFEWCVNLVPNKKLNKSELEVLSLDLNYVPTPRNLPTIDFIAPIERIIGNDSFAKVEKEEIRNKLTYILNNYKQQKSNVTTEQSKTIQNLRNNPNYVILKADKGNKTVLMLRSDYENKILSQLSDESTYKIHKIEIELK